MENLESGPQRIVNSREELSRIVDQLRDATISAPEAPRIREIRRLLNAAQVTQVEGKWGLAGDLFTPGGSLRSEYHLAKTCLVQQFGKGIPEPGKRIELHKPAGQEVLLVSVVTDQNATWVGEDRGYLRLVSLLEKRPPIRRAILIQHSADSIRMHLLKSLLESGAEIELFVQHPNATISKGQKKKVDALVENLAPFFQQSGDEATNRLKVFYYHAPASVRAVLIDDDLLAVGWYTYIQRKENLKLRNAMDVQGTYMPMIQTTRGTAEWPPLKKMFDYLYADLKKFAVEWVPSDVLPMQK